MNFRDLFGAVLDWIYPPVCVSCGAYGALICESCLSGLPPVGNHYCSKCGKPLMPKHHCRICSRSDFRFLASRAPYLYDGPVSAMIKSLKYRGTLGLVPVLSDLLTGYWERLKWDVDLVIPVPLSRKRRAERGFNQSEMIAAAFAKKTGIRSRPEALMKTRDTLRQVGLSAQEREINLRGAFAAEPAFVRGKQVLLLDDVMTTGSTFAECSAVLLDAGARSVRCLSVATTPLQHGNNKAESAETLSS
ncbi:MAG: ComF family protein [Anaerolineaceae bacterium]|nr:ComF family protein [Anaerolineaceae bacterium]